MSLSSNAKISFFSGVFIVSNKAIAFSLILPSHHRIPRQMRLVTEIFFVIPLLKPFGR